MSAVREYVVRTVGDQPFGCVLPPFRVQENVNLRLNCNWFIPA